MSFFEECRMRAEQALAILERGQNRDKRKRMQLCVAIALSQTDTLRSNQDAYDACAAALTIAQMLDDIECELRALSGIWRTHVDGGAFEEAVATTERLSGLGRAPAGTARQLPAAICDSPAQHIARKLTPSPRRHRPIQITI
jgi:hypothetical protein